MAESSALEQDVNKRILQSMPSFGSSGISYWSPHSQINRKNKLYLCIQGHGEGVKEEGGGWEGEKSPSGKRLSCIMVGIKVFGWEYYYQ